MTLLLLCRIAGRMAALAPSTASSRPETPAQAASGQPRARLHSAMPARAERDLSEQCPATQPPADGPAQAYNPEQDLVPWDWQSECAPYCNSCSVPLMSMADLLALISHVYHAKVRGGGGRGYTSIR